MEIILDKVRSFGGQIHELSPTGVLAAFGLEPVEDAPRRAAHAAMAVERAVARARKEDPARPGVKLAIHTAELLVGRVDGVAEMDADAQSAARAMLDALVDPADAGMVVVSASSATFLRRWFDLTAHGPVEGVPGPVYRLGCRWSVNLSSLNCSVILSSLVSRRGHESVPRIQANSAPTNADGVPAPRAHQSGAGWGRTFSRD
jgi:hypothetical protein